MRTLLIISVILFTLPIISRAQCMMVPLSLNKRVVNASTIVLGKVKQRTPYLSEGNRIYTSNLFEISAYLKGYSNSKFLIVISEGGVLDNRAELVHPALEMDTTQEVLLFLTGENTFIDNKYFRKLYGGIPQMEAYGCSQGKLTYQKGLYYDLLSEAPQSEISVLKKIKKISKKYAVTPEGKLYTPRSAGYEGKGRQGSSRIAAISGVSPNPGIAGTINVADQITISGSGFGAIPGTVEFSNADDGGATMIQSPIPATDIVSWSDVQIVLKVPTRAGTGTIRVNGIFTIPFTVNYAHLEINNTFSGFASATRQRFYLVNRDGSGGYTFKYNTTFASNLPAVAAFARALGSWRCNTFVNFSISPAATATAAVANDGVNTVFFDATLSAGVLGRATSHYTAVSTGGCMLQNTLWNTADIDIQFQNPPSAGFTWNYGPAASIAFGTTYDFESVALHELGHAHGLGHIIASGKVMNYSLFNGEDARTLDPVSDIAGGNAKVAYSTVAANYCIQYPAGIVGPMVALNGASCALPVSLLSFTGKRIEQGFNLVQWTTAEEHDNKGFELEKSSDGITYTSIAFVEAQQGVYSQHAYSFDDYFSGKELVSYYRLTQEDNDGLRTTLPSIRVDAIEEETVFIYFEPGDKIIYAVFNPPFERDSELILYNIAGQIVSREKIVRGSTHQICQAQLLASGVYTYSILGNHINLRGKIAVQQVW